MPKPFRTLDDLPKTIAVFPLSGALLLPRGALPLNVFEPRYLAMVDDALASHRLIGMIQPIEPEEHTLKPALSQVGCVGRITSFKESEDHRYQITLTGLCRFRVAEELQADTAYRQVTADYFAFGGDLVANESSDVPRQRLIAALTRSSSKFWCARSPKGRWFTTAKSRN